MKTKILFSLLGIFVFLSCENNSEVLDETQKQEEEAPILQKEIFTGYVQKGPFINGSSVLILELDALLDQTGRSYSTNVIDNTGSFEQKNIELRSNFVQLKADGYYFNEISGKTSEQITLSALVDISNTHSANVNVLTHLERRRVEYLVKEENQTFSEAKKQAQKEVLAIFNLELPEEVASESLDLTENAILLAISCILQGPISTAKMVELMADISSDIRTDGTLDNLKLGSRLLDNALAISLPKVRANLEKKYAELNEEISISDFETYVNQFVEKTSYEKVEYITYPETGSFGLNVLSETLTSITIGTDYSMKAEVPEGLYSLKVIVRGGLWHTVVMPLPVNWFAGYYDQINQSQEFNVIESGKPNDLSITSHYGDDNGYTTFECYENGATEPSYVKIIEIKQ
jgi:hypothetical protein